MNELLNVNFEKQTVSARELHGQLHIGTEFAKWFSRMCEYGFSAENDYSEVIVKNDENSKGGRPATDYNISVDMAKQICMIQRTPEGKAVRQYLIDLEKAWNTPEQVMARALKIANNMIEEKDHLIAIQDSRIQEMVPKEIFADAVATSHTSILIGDLAKLICQNGYQIGQKRLFDWLRENGYLVKNGSSKNMPLQRYVEQGLFEVKERNVQNPDGSVRITRTTKVTGKGQVYFIKKFLRTSFA